MDLCTEIIFLLLASMIVTDIFCFLRKKTSCLFSSAHFFVADTAWIQNTKHDLSFGWKDKQTQQKAQS